MPVIDADAHVIETDETWDYMQPGEERFKPASITERREDSDATSVWWQFDRNRELRMLGYDKITGTTRGTRELSDVAARVRHMDELGIDVHVIYPTVLLQGVTVDVLSEVAIKRSYNRWLAERCQGSGGRLRWVCAPPLLDMEKSLAELRWAKEHGACGVMKKADAEAGRWPNDPYFFPLYAEAERLGLPICFHTGTGNAEQLPPDKWLHGRLQRLTMPVATAVHTVLLFDLPNQFPTLRWAFIEAGAAWLPYIIGNLKRRAEKIAADNPLSYRELKFAQRILAENRIYVTCFPDEDLPYLVNMFGPDNLIAGSDYGHADPARENSFDQRLRGRAAAGDITAETVDKILFSNPKTLYGI